MIIIIDAYNILKPIYEKRHISEYEQQHFIKELIQFARQRRHHITVVFDGGEYHRPVSYEPDERVTVWYSGDYLDADNVICKIMRGKPADNMLLVTSDGELITHARACQVVSIDAVPFYRFIKRELRHTEPIHPTKAVHKREGHISSPEVDELMQSTTEVVHKSEDDDERRVVYIRPHARSLGDKRTYAILRKL